MKRRRLTYRAVPMVAVAVRMPRPDRERWHVASKKLGVSQSLFLREALRERAERVLTTVGQ